ncbi:MAG: hypothetical protein V7K43_31065 [Nostoc sp.]
MKKSKYMWGEFPDLYPSGEASYAQRLPFSQGDNQVVFEERKPNISGALLGYALRNPTYNFSQSQAYCFMNTF